MLAAKLIPEWYIWCGVCQWDHQLDQTQLCNTQCHTARTMSRCTTVQSVHTRTPTVQTVQNIKHHHTDHSTTGHYHKDYIPEHSAI